MAYSLLLRVTNDNALTVIIGAVSKAAGEGIEIISVNTEEKPLSNGDDRQRRPHHKQAKQHSQAEMVTILEGFMKRNPVPSGVGYHNDDIASFLSEEYLYKKVSIPSMLSRFVRDKIMERIEPSGNYQFTAKYKDHVPASNKSGKRSIAA